jgi:hypothetical protein
VTRAGAIRIITDYLSAGPAPWERVEEDFFYVRIPGVNRRVIPIEISVGQRTVRALSYFVIEPEENVADAYRFLLQRNMSGTGVAFASDKENSIVLTGRVRLDDFDEQALDELIGKIVDATESTFQPFLRIGFESRFS